LAHWFTRTELDVGLRAIAGQLAYAAPRRVRTGEGKIWGTDGEEARPTRLFYVRSTPQVRTRSGQLSAVCHKRP